MILAKLNNSIGRSKCGIASTMTYTKHYSWIKVCEAYLLFIDSPIILVLMVPVNYCVLMFCNNTANSFGALIIASWPILNS